MAGKPPPIHISIPEAEMAQPPAAIKQGEPKSRFQDPLRPEARTQVTQIRDMLGEIVSLGNDELNYSKSTPTDIEAIKSASMKTIADLPTIPGLSAELRQRITSLMEQELRAAGKIPASMTDIPAEITQKAYSKWLQTDAARLHAETRLKELNAIGITVSESATALQIEELYEKFQRDRTLSEAVATRMGETLSAGEPEKVMKQFVEGKFDELEKGSQGTTLSHKLREQQRGEITRIFRDIRLKDKQSRLPAGGAIGDLIRSPDLLSDDIQALTNAIKARLQLAGKKLSDPNSIDELSNKYHALLDEEQQQISTFDFQQFYKENPAIRTDNSIGFAGTGKKEVVNLHREGIPISFGLETQTADKDKLAVLMVNDKKNHDAIGLSKNPDGSLNIAVADGVSNCMVPRVASRLAVRVALEDMQVEAPSAQTLERAYNELQSTDIPNIARKEIADWERKAAQATDSIYQRSLRNYVDFLKTDYMQKGKLAMTTLGVAKYDKNASRLQIALKSDTSARIFHADGTMNSYQNPDMSMQLQYDPNPDASYSHTAETVQDIPLKPGDLILIHTDGLKGDMINELNERLNKTRSSSNRLDTTAMALTENILRREGVDDDISAVFVYHE